MSVSIPAHRGAPTTRALVSAATDGAEGDLLVVVGDAEVESSTGTIILDVDDHSASEVTGTGTVRTVGLAGGADFGADDVETTDGGTAFTLVGPAEGLRVSLRLVGERHVVPALAAIAAGVELGVPIATAVAAVESVASTEDGNFALSSVGGVTVIDDGYDTGSRSTVEALKTLAEIAGETRRSIAVLGELDLASDDLLEVRDEHDRIGRIVVRLNIAQLIVVGAGGRHLSTAAGLEGSWDGESLLVATLDEAYAVLRAEIREGDVVLVKVPALASRLIEGLA